MNISSLPRIKPLAQGCPCGASAEDALCDAGLALRRWALPGRGLAGLGDLRQNGRRREEDWRALFLLLLSQLSSLQPRPHFTSEDKGWKERREAGKLPSLTIINLWRGAVLSLWGDSSPLSPV